MSVTASFETGHHGRGVAFGVGAGALWGLVFLVPELAGSFSPLELTIGRYVAYGLISAVLIAPRWRRLRSLLTRRDWMVLCFLATSGNTLYYILLASGVQLGGIATTSLVMAFLPVGVTILGTRTRNAVPLGKLLPSLLFCCAAALTIGWEALTAPISGDPGRQVLGLAFAFGALAIWTSFAVVNSAYLARLISISVHDWSLLTGIVAALQAIALLLPMAMFDNGWAQHSVSAWQGFIALCVGIALFSSVVGNALWNQMSRLLPMTMAGQMILFETIFAVAYGLIWDWRLPTHLELITFVLIVAGVASCLAAHRALAR